MPHGIAMVDSSGHIATPPVVVACDDDQAAIEKAKRLLDGRTMEVWEEQRKIAAVAPVYPQS
jgi:adenylosuccinate lyase